MNLCSVYWCLGMLSASSTGRLWVFKKLVRLMPGVMAIIALAAILGLTFNSLKSDRLPLIRKPLRETRRYTTAADLLAMPQKGFTASTRAISVQPSGETKTIAQVPSEHTKSENKPSLISSVGMEKPARSHGEEPVDGQHSAEIERMIQPAESPEKPKQAEALFTTLEDAKALYDKNVALFVDGRLPIDYEAEHISGAVNLFCEKVDDMYEKVLGNVPKDKVIVTYCSDPECTESIKLADALVAKGFTKVVILLEGLPGWKNAGYSTVRKEPE